MSGNGFNFVDVHEAIGAGAERLRAGGVVAFPTETVYGLGADAWNAGAVGRVFELKGRPAHNPLIVHVTGPEMAREVSAEWPEWAETLARAFWPGPLTLVLARSGRVPSAVTAGGPTVAVRAPAHPAAMALLYAVGRPLVGPSANRSGRVSPTSAVHVRESFGDEVPVIDGGACSAGIESTVVRFAGGPSGGPEILRPGVIGPTAIAAALGMDVARIGFAGARAGHASGNGALASPGMLAEHYAPTAPAVLFERPEWASVVTLGAGGPIAVLSFGPMNASDAAEVIEMPSSAGAYAAELYAALRAADAMGPALIAIESPPAPGRACGGEAELWHAIADRLGRAARRV